MANDMPRHEEVRQELRHYVGAHPASTDEAVDLMLLHGIEQAEQDGISDHAWCWSRLWTLLTKQARLEGPFAGKPAGQHGVFILPDEVSETCGIVALTDRAGVLRWTRYDSPKALVGGMAEMLTRMRWGQFAIAKGPVPAEGWRAWLIAGWRWLQSFRLRAGNNGCLRRPYDAEGEWQA